MRSQDDLIRGVLMALADGEHLPVDALRQRLRVRRQRLFAVLTMMAEDGAIDGRLEMIVARDGKRRRLRVYSLPESVKEPGSRERQPGSQFESDGLNADAAPQST